MDEQEAPSSRGPPARPARTRFPDLSIIHQVNGEAPGRGGLQLRRAASRGRASLRLSRNMTSALLVFPPAARHHVHEFSAVGRGGTTKRGNIYTMQRLIGGGGRMWVRRRRASLRCICQLCIINVYELPGGGGGRRPRTLVT